MRSIRRGNRRNTVAPVCHLHLVEAPTRLELPPPESIRFAAWLRRPSVQTAVDVLTLFAIGVAVLAIAYGSVW